MVSRTAAEKAPSGSRIWSAERDARDRSGISLVGRLFDPDRTDVACCGDITYIPTDEGWLYLASTIDLASRHLIGWSMADRHDARLVCDALDAAMACRGRRAMDDVIMHTDRGAERGTHLDRVR